MKKRFIALFIIFTMLVSISPAVVANDTIPRPTVEEILNEYHEKAFEAEIAGETSAATYSPRSGSPEKTLEQETVDTLNAAGYEAYNVTAENYEAIEAQLQTNFDDMGLDPNGSYIIAISGEETEDSSASGINPRAMVPVKPDYDSTFEYTYNGTTYTMRYVTVTAETNNHLGCSSPPIDLLTEYGAVDAWEDLEIPISVFSSLGMLPYTGTIYSLFTPVILNSSPRQTSTLTLTAGSNWTVKYTQIYNTQAQQWKMCGSIEYVNMSYVINHYHYSSTANAYVQDSISGRYATVYSTLYNNSETMKERAAFAYQYTSCWQDTVDYVVYDIGDETTITHHRWNEPTGYEPT